MDEAKVWPCQAKVISMAKTKILCIDKHTDEVQFCPIVNLGLSQVLDYPDGRMNDLQLSTYDVIGTQHGRSPSHYL